MYRLLSERARLQVLVSVSQRENCPLTGCWLRHKGSWRWRSWNGSHEPREGNFYPWKSLGLRLASPTVLSSEALGRLRRLYRKGLFGRLRKQLLSRWADSLRCQRSSLAQQLHRGVCQRMTLLELQSHWLQNCPAEERPQAELDLRESISLLNTEFADFFQDQLNVLSSSAAVDWPPYGPPQAVRLLCQELVRMARGVDRKLHIEQGDRHLTLGFVCNQEQRKGLIPLLQGLRWAGLEIHHEVDDVLRLSL